MPKELDLAFKTFSVSDPPVLTALFGGVPLDPDTRVTNITERIPATRLDPDCILSVVNGGLERRLQFEAFAHWRAEIRERMHGYNSFYRHANGSVARTDRDPLPARWVPGCKGGGDV